MRTRLYWGLLVIGLTACGSVEKIDDNNNNDGGSTCELTECGTACVDTNTDRNHCGSCDNACGADDICVQGRCDAFDNAVTAAFETTPRDPTGWLDPDGNPIAFSFAAFSDVPQAVYECRTGPAMMIGGLDFAPCDGGDGSQPVHEPAPAPNMEEGSYRTEVRVRVDDLVTAPAGFGFYAHHSLDSAATCPQPFTDEQIFTAAAPLLSGNPGPFADSARTRNPFLVLPFTNVAPSSATQQTGSPWLGITGNDFTVQARSLRRRLALSADRRLLLVQRQYVSRRGVAAGQTNLDQLCRNGIVYRTSPNPAAHGDTKIDCQTMVVNSRGFSRCVVDDGNGNPVASFPSNNGFIKLNSRWMFSPKGDSDVCPSNRFNPGACAFDYLVLPL